MSSPRYESQDDGGPLTLYKTKNLPPRQLYNVNTDVGEESNVQDKYPKVVQRMLALMQTYIDAGRSTPGPSQSNDVPILFTP